MTQSEGRGFAWHADKYDQRLASIRYRLSMPMAALVARGVAIERYDPARGPGSYRAILFSKSHGTDAVAIAQAARDAGTGVVLDSCDNVFAAHAAGHFSDARLERMRRMLGLATHASFSTATLAEQAAAAFPALTERRWVIPDTLETDPPADAPAPLLARIERERLRRFLARHHDALHCVWFGKSLGGLSGFAHLDAMVARLTAFSPRHRVTLTIIGNDRLQYVRQCGRWAVPNCYVGWNAATFRPVLAMHDVAVIPVEANAYTLGKTINRPATALMAGLGVIADAIPAYEELRPFIAMDGWAEGLARYAASSDDGRIAAGQAHVCGRYGADAVAGRWMQLLETFPDQPLPGTMSEIGSPDP